MEIMIRGTDAKVVKKRQLKKPVTKRVIARATQSPQGRFRKRAIEASSRSEPMMAEATSEGMLPAAR